MPEKANAQVALESAALAHSNRTPFSGSSFILATADKFLEWLNNNTEVTKTSVDLEK